MDVQEAQAAVAHDPEHNLTHFGAVVNGVFHSFAAIRHGDFTEAQQAGEKTQQQNQQQTEGQVQ